MSLPIFLSEFPSDEGGRVTQLFPRLELFSEGDPPRNTLFVLATPPLSAATSEPDQLLIVDPPVDLTTRFMLEGNVAVLFSGEPSDVSVTQVQTQPGGVAHLQVGDHFLDIYSQARHNIVHLPAVGVLWGGRFGSDVLPPRLTSGTDGSDELDTLRLLAALVKRNVQLFIPQVGTSSEDRVVIMRRLADDVAYLHALRRTVPAALQRGDDFARVEALGETLLPEAWSTPRGRAIHGENLRILVEVFG